MDRKQEKKEDREILFLHIILLIVVVFFVTIITINPKGKEKEAEAYTTDIVSYSSDTITDLTNTTWKLKSTINLGLNETFNVDISYEDYTFDSIRFFAEDWSGEGLYTYGLYFESYI